MKNRYVGCCTKFHNHFLSANDSSALMMFGGPRVTTLVAKTLTQKTVVPTPEDVKCS